MGSRRLNSQARGMSETAHTSGDLPRLLTYPLREHEGEKNASRAGAVFGSIGRRRSHDLLRNSRWRVDVLLLALVEMAMPTAAEQRLLGCAGKLAIAANLVHKESTVNEASVVSNGVAWPPPENVAPSI